MNLKSAKGVHIAVFGISSEVTEAQWYALAKSKGREHTAFSEIVRQVVVEWCNMAIWNSLSIQTPEKHLNDTMAPTANPEARLVQNFLFS